MNFTDFSLHPKVQAGIDACGYTQPTAIQEQAIPSALQGRDLMGLAQTGTGKTAAFVLPLLERLLAGKRSGVRGLILSPTRELAEQTLEFVQALGRRTGLKGVSVYGGVSRAGQIKKLRSGADIVVACPGRLLDLARDRAVDLSRVETLVLDEGDRMLDMGFMPDIRSIIKQLPARRQNMLFSATMPKTIRSLAEEILNDPVSLKIGQEQPLEGISQHLYPVDRRSKPEMLINLLRGCSSEATLVFTRTKHTATKLARKLCSSGMRAKDLQGNMSQANRRQVLQGFREGRFPILVATDVASRGIDVTRIGHVINYDVPDTTEAYTHRLGRTGRVDSTGRASTFVEPGDFGLIKAIERAQGRRIQRGALGDRA
ncbi:MAG: DEAD/DEAH box helicase [Desulfohalobiaceae bacterium]|nr:DEAD/DEAH box helicase [Desulfohalobiaceae bacterium]